MSIVDDISVVGFKPLIEKTKRTLSQLDEALLRCARERETTIYVLSPQQRFADVGASYASLGPDDSACLGLYDWSSNRIVLRSIEAACQSHELFHLIDFDLGGPQRFRSQDEPAIVNSYRRRRKDGMFVSSYASVNPTEYAAEIARAVMGWSTSRTLAGRTDASRVLDMDPDACAVIQSMIAELRQRYGEPTASQPSRSGTAAIAVPEFQGQEQ